ncbi:heparinase II/III family protein (plasmid) [Cytobacillus spongiae]|uniref:alginate lyase family protein n=1 Tax=Cytobacillus spongiae TaxID=2901381 RepID=UPI001F3FC9F3|nr:alginate lyase family protein [Cytobacillus spongiae]UII58049.1 heparinase II/III family protein [Cytobacillus spongiae]
MSEGRILYSWPEDKQKIVQFYKDKKTNLQIKKLQDLLIKPLNKNNYMYSSENILKGNFSFPSYGTINFTNGIDWENKSNRSRSFLRQLHGHFFLTDLIASFAKLGKKEYITYGFSIIKDWISKNPKPIPKHKMAWSDEVTARRLVIWIHFFDCARSLLSEKEISFFYENILLHVNLLRTESFHTTNTNHGMFQDESLLVFSEYFNNIKESNEIKKLAIKRLTNYFNYIISSEGVHLEHSPSYHQVISNAVLRYAKFFENSLDHHFFSQKYDSLADYATYIIKPDGRWPLIGDTFFKDIPSSHLWPHDKHYLYAISKGFKGLPPPYIDKVFPQSGYAVFRDEWKKGNGGTYLLFYAAYYTSYHKHCDDLSIWLYSDGDILVESGPNGYDYEDPFTKYAYSSFSHNTLIVDDTSLPRVDNKFNHVKIQQYKIGKDYSEVKGINRRYPGVVHERTIKYQKSQKFIKVHDKIISTKMHNYKVLWHFAPDIDVQHNSNEVICFRNSRKVMKLSIHSKSNIKTRLLRGSKDPVLGWFIGQDAKKTPINTLIIETNDINSEIISNLQLY